MGWCGAPPKLVASLLMAINLDRYLTVPPDEPMEPVRIAEVLHQHMNQLAHLAATLRAAMRSVFPQALFRTQPS